VPPREAVDEWPEADALDDARDAKTPPLHAGKVLEAPRPRADVFTMCLAVPGQVIELVDPEGSLARVDIAGVRRTVDVQLLERDGQGAVPGDWVLVHVGFALSKVDEAEALATLRLLRDMGDAFEQELEDLGRSLIE
jgi:hydrogenase expression/formation protein HypC